MRNDPQTPRIDSVQRTEGSRTDVEREKMQQREKTDESNNRRKLGETVKSNDDESLKGQVGKPDVDKTRNR